MTLALFCACLLGLVGYLIVSGFHDAPNAVAVPTRTRALTPTMALYISAGFNFLGVLAAGFLFAQYTPRWLTVPENEVGLALIFTALAAQIIWGFITWWLRMPSSSTHALLGGILGSAWAAGAVGLGTVEPFTESFYAFVILPLILIPLGIFFLSWLLVFPLRRWVQLAYPRTVNRVSRNVMSLANSVISLVHGVQVGQRALVLMFVATLAARLPLPPGGVFFLSLCCALCSAAGTLLGGWRIGYTFAHKMVHLDPLRGSVAQGATALVMSVSQLLLNTSISSSHVAAASVLGAGLNQRFSSVRPGIAARLILTWLATIPLSFAFSALLFLALSPLLA